MDKPTPVLPAERKRTNLVTAGLLVLWVIAVFVFTLVKYTGGPR